LTLKHDYSGKAYDCNKVEKCGYEEEFLTSLHYDMLRIRRIEEEIERRYHEDEMKSPIHLVIGQEATSVGACAALRQQDLVYCGHRTHGHYLAKGGSLKKMLSELYCRLNGCAGSRGGSMHLFDKSAGMAGSSAIVAGAIPIAAGAALSFQTLKQDNVSLVFFGDAATEEGACWEAINFSTLRKIPVVFFCENNFFSVCSSLDVRQPSQVKIFEKAQGFGLPSVQVDGTNVLDIYEATKEAVDRARKGDGPTFIEAPVYRWRGHGGAGDDSISGYRDPNEVRQWEKYCPINKYKELLEEMKIYNDAEQKKEEHEILNEISEAFDHAISSANPEESDLLTHIYSP
jgi:acetoin:2,6-dichlorophenolindophenol oxidoreductase subunit alpha